MAAKIVGCWRPVQCGKNHMLEGILDCGAFLSLALPGSLVKSHPIIPQQGCITSCCRIRGCGFTRQAGFFLLFLTRYVFAFSRKAGFCSSRSTSEKMGRSNRLETRPIPAPQSRARPGCTRADGPYSVHNSMKQAQHTHYYTHLSVRRESSWMWPHLVLTGLQSHPTSHPLCSEHSAVEINTGMIYFEPSPQAQH